MLFSLAFAAAVGVLCGLYLMDFRRRGWESKKCHEKKSYKITISLSLREHEYFEKERNRYLLKGFFVPLMEDGIQEG